MPHSDSFHEESSTKRRSNKEREAPPPPSKGSSLPDEKVGNLKQRKNREDGCKELKDDTPEKENTLKNIGNLGAHNRPETKTPEEEDRNNFGENEGKTEEEEEEGAAVTKEERKEARQKPTKRETPHVRT